MSGSFIFIFIHNIFLTRERIYVRVDGYITVAQVCVDDTFLGHNFLKRFLGISFITLKIVMCLLVV